MRSRVVFLSLAAAASTLCLREYWLRRNDLMRSHSHDGFVGTQVAEIRTRENRGWLQAPVYRPTGQSVAVWGLHCTECGLVTSPKIRSEEAAEKMLRCPHQPWVLDTDLE